MSRFFMPLHLSYIVLRRSIRSRPTPIARRTLPYSFYARHLTIQAPGSTFSEQDGGDNGSKEIQLIDSSSPSAAPVGSSQHPFAAVESSGDTSTAVATSSTATHLPTPPEPLLASALPDIPHPFNTHAFVNYLENNGHGPVNSRALMEAVRELIIWRRQRTRNAMVGREDMENEAYLFRAGLSELRTELSVRTRNDGVAFRAMSGAIRREVEGLEQKMKEDVQTLKHDIEMDMNNRKSETRSEMKSFDIAIEEINNKFTISLGDLRTEIESSKWEATRRAITVIVLVVVFVIAVTTLAGDTSQAKAATPPLKPVTSSEPMRDMAVGTDDEEEVEVGVDTEKKLEQLLSNRRVEIPVTRVRPGRGTDVRSQQETLNVDRI